MAMLRSAPQLLAPATILLALMLAAVPVQPASASITGGEGNTPVRDPGWPEGAEKIFNNPARVAWWEGPPFGGGQWHGEFRGDAKTLNAVLADFARLDVKNKRIVVHDGVGHSFWLNANRTPDKKEAAKIDWIFMVWQGANFERLRKLPADLNPTNAADADKGPPSQIDVYTGGNIRWSEVKVPKGIKVVDQRLEAHGFKSADGVVLEGKVVDLATERPLEARMRLERIEPQKTGGYKYTVAAETEADEEGRWVLKNAPEGWHRVVVEADGYVPRIVGYGQFDDQPRWHAYDTALSKAVAVSGSVTDEGGKPLADAQVRIGDVAPEGAGRYESPSEYKINTDADGRFHFDQVPVGKATIWVHKSGYCRPGLGQAITTPSKDVALKMIKAANLRVTIDFTGTDRPENYLVNIEPEGGSKIGSWGGSGQIDEKNQISFADVPPGRYVIQGRPNPGSEKQTTKPITIELKGGDRTELTLSLRGAS